MDLLQRSGFKAKLASSACTICVSSYKNRSIAPHGIGSGTQCVARGLGRLHPAQGAVPLHQRLRQAFDPAGILNPGRVIA